MKMIANKTFKLFNTIASLWAPPPELTVSEWADRYRRLSSEASAEPGRWYTDRAPYQREIMNAINDPNVEEIAVISSAQVGKSEIILNDLGYFIDQDPAPVMLLQPTLEMAQAFSKDRLAPMLRDSPALKDKVKDVKSRDSGNTQLHKKFPGGHITLAGANAPAALASRPIRIVLCDEVDRYPASAGTEGDPVALVTNRTKTFWNRKHIYVSTPTIKGISKIEALYENSTMEQWCLSCPSCKAYQPLSWNQITFDYDEKMKTASNVLHACKECGSLHKELEWKNADGKWIARQEGLKRRGFHLNELSSPWSSWEKIAEKFKEANEALKKGNKEPLKTWINTALGETWEEKGESVDSENLSDRVEEYVADVPPGALILTAGVDVQDDRFEIEIVGWGGGKESWGVEYKVIPGDLKQPHVWNQLGEYLEKTWENHDGTRFHITATCMDSGGHFTDEVYRFCKRRESRRVYAIKGRGEDGIPYIGKPTRAGRIKAALFPIGVNIGKEHIYSRLKVENAGSGYCHFPNDPEKGYDKKYFKGLTSEQKVERFVKGKIKYEWVKKYYRNEPLDCRNYATAALEIVNPNFEALAKYGGSRQVKNKRRVISKGI
ncbi:terminase [Brevibacillus laterosporus]|nr:terminase [Brevibacillus laterosporus]